MSRFYGTVSGQAKTEATRCGSAKSGIVSHAAGWSGSVRAEVFDRGGVDWANVSLSTWSGSGINMNLYSGPVGGPASLESDPSVEQRIIEKTWILLAGQDAQVVELFKALFGILQPYQYRVLEEKLSRVGIEV